MVLPPDLPQSITFTAPEITDYTYGSIPSSPLEAPTKSVSLKSGHTFVYEYVITGTTVLSTSYSNSSYPTIPGSGPYTLSLKSVNILSGSTNVNSEYNIFKMSSQFYVSKQSIIASISMPDFTYGDTPSSPSLTFSLVNGDTKNVHSFTYKTGTVAKSEKPTTPGTHTVTYVTPVIMNGTTDVTPCYNLGISPVNYKVSLRPVTLSISMPDFTYGNTPSIPSVSNWSTSSLHTKGTASFTYKTGTVAKSEKQTTPGVHTVTYVPVVLYGGVNVTSYYSFTGLVADYTVFKRTLSATLTMNGYQAGGTPSSPTYNAVNVISPDQITSVSYTYNGTTLSGVTYNDTTLPLVAGSYTVSDAAFTIMSGSTDVSSYYDKTVNSPSFTVGRLPINATMTNYEYGGTSTPSFAGATLNANDEIVSFIPTFTGTTLGGVSFTSNVAPTSAGTYSLSIVPTIRSIINNNNNSQNYLPVLSGFVVTAKPTIMNLYMDSYVSGQTPSTPTFTHEPLIGNDLITSVSYNYVGKTNTNADYSSPVKPTVAGTYSMSAVFAIKNKGIDHTKNYIGTSTPVPFTVSQNQIYIKTVMTDFTVGTTPPTPYFIQNGYLNKDDSLELIQYTYSGTTLSNENYDSILKPTLPGTYEMSGLFNIMDGTVNHNLNYNIAIIKSTFHVLQIQLTISAVTTDYPTSTPATPSFNAIGLVNGDRLTVSFDFEGTSMPSTSGTFIQKIKSFNIKDTNGNDVGYKYDVTRLPTTFKVKIPFDVRPKVNNYYYGTIGTAYSDVIGYDGPITHEYKFGTSNDLPTNVGTYTISQNVTIPNPEMYDITVKKTNFRVLPLKHVVKLQVNGTTVTAYSSDALRIGDNAVYTIKYGTSETLPTTSGKHRVTVSVVIRRGSEIVTSNYNVITPAAIITIPEPEE